MLSWWIDTDEFSQSKRNTSVEVIIKRRERETKAQDRGEYDKECDPEIRRGCVRAKEKKKKIQNDGSVNGQNRINKSRKCRRLCQSAGSGPRLQNLNEPAKKMIEKFKKAEE